MTSFDPLHPKTGAIVELLSERHSLAARELKSLLKREKGISVSTANFYKILGKMIEHQMLVKTGETVSLNMVWATTLRKFAAMTHEHAGQDGIESFPPLKEGERRSFTAESLKKIDPLWTHLILTLFSRESDPVIHVYESHPYYILGQPETERRMYEGCRTEGKEIRMLYGNTSFLDRYVLQLHKNSPCKAAITDAPPFPKEGYNLWLCGNTLIECTFPELIAQYFGTFFATTKSAEEFDLKTFSSVFDINVPAELRVSRDAKKAARLRKLFSENWRK